MPCVEGIFFDLFQGGLCQTLMSEWVHDHYANFGPLMFGVKIDDVNNAHGLMLVVLDHHAHLAVGIDVVLGVGKIVVEHITSMSL